MPKYTLLLSSLILIITVSCNNEIDQKINHNRMLIRRIDSLNRAGYEITDYHAHLKGGLTMDQVLEHSELTGIKYGVAVNGGVGFPVHSDTALSTYFRSIRKYPVYHGLQCEGREWKSLFSPDSVKLFDYVFTDAMTFTDADGNRNRLWIKEETHVKDPEVFMEYLVKQIETILATENVDIYVNPTYLPDTISSRYTELWTPERMQRVVNALKSNGVAMEINSRFRLPSPEFIKMAKAAGVKFTMGTNNGDADLGYLEYGLDMILECNLKPEDFWKCTKQNH
jgi:hypothetical protein